MDFAQSTQIVLHFGEHIDTFAAHSGFLIYVVLFAIVFCEIGILPLLFLPGDPLIFLCGAFCATGAIKLWIVMPVLFVATVAGSILSYATGHALRNQVLARDYRWLNKSALQRSQAFYERYGAITFLISPFVAVLRTFAPFAAGIAMMAFPKYLFSVTGGALLWVGILVLGGYFFGNVPLIRDHMNAIVLSGIGLGLGGLVVSSLWRYFKRR